jgi:WD40 repeat protein
VRIWDASTGDEQVTTEPVEEGPDWVWFGPDGRAVFARTLTKGLTCWDAATGQQRWHTPVPGFLMSHEQSPDGKYLIAMNRPRIGGPEPGVIRVWDAATGREVNVLKPAPSAYAIFIGPDSRRLAVIVGPLGATLLHPGPWTIQVFDILTGAGGAVFRGHNLGIGGVAFSPDGRRLASVAKNGPGDRGEVKVWDADTGAELLHLTNGEYGDWIRFSTDGHRLAMYNRRAFRGTVAKVWDATPRAD